MALHMGFNLNNNIQLNAMNGMHAVAPTHIYSLFNTFGHITEDQFLNRAVLYIPTINLPGQEFNAKQYWVRYLMCAGRINDAIQQINYIGNNHVEGLTIHKFLNETHTDFNGNTILHHALLWLPNVNLLRVLIEYGAEVDIEDNDGNFPEEGIHNTLWFNPFSRILDMPPIFHHHQTDDFGYIEREVWYIRNEDDFMNGITYISVQAGEQEEPTDEIDDDNDY